MRVNTKNMHTCKTGQEKISKTRLKSTVKNTREYWETPSLYKV